jgi:hypothetical protein
MQLSARGFGFELGRIWFSIVRSTVRAIFNLERSRRKRASVAVADVIDLIIWLGGVQRFNSHACQRRERKAQEEEEERT